LVISPASPRAGIVKTRMPKSFQSHALDRPRRVKLAGSVLVLLRMENNRQVTGKLHMLSVTGGLVHLQKPLDEGIKVEVIFHVGTTVRGRARMLFPMWATQGCLQPFQFSDLGEEARHQLEQNLEKFLVPAETSPDD
jgi:hypothetical protein